MSGYWHALLCDSRHKDTRYAWVVLCAVFFNQLICMGVPYASGVMTVAFKERYNASLADTAWATSINTGLSVGAAPLAAQLISRYGYRNTAFLGSFLSVCGISLSTLPSQLWVLYITFGVVAGTGFCFVYMASATIIPEYFEKYQLFAFAVVATGAGTGNLCMAPILQALLDASGLHTCLFGISALCSLQAVCSIFLRKPHRNSLLAEEEGSSSYISAETMDRSALENASVPVDYKSIEKPYTEIEDTAQTETKLSSPMTMVLQLVKDWSLWTYCFANLCFEAGANTVFLLIADYAIDHDNISASPARAALIITVIGACTTGGQLLLSLAGLVTDVPVGIIFCLSLLVYGVASAMIPFMQSYSTLSGCCALFGFGYGIFIGLVIPVTRALFQGEKLNYALGFALFFQGIGLMIGPPLTGLLKDIASYNWSFYCGGFFDLAALLLLAVILLQRELRSLIHIVLR